MVYGRIPVSHIVAALALAALLPVAPAVDLLTMGWLTTLILLTAGLWEGRQARVRRASLGEPAAH